MAQQIVGYLDYVTQEGDQFDAIAMAAYSEERMASAIIAANPEYCDVVIFEAGIPLSIPVFEQIETAESLPPWRRPTT